MLSTFRSHIKGWLAWALIIIISLPFALWGIGNYSGVITSQSVAQVNGVTITPQNFQTAYQNFYQRRQNALGKKFDPSEAQQEALKDRVMQTLITHELLRQRANAYRMLASDALVKQKIRQKPFFQINGTFSYQRYLRILAQNQISPAQYQATVRNNLKSRILQRGLTISAFATPAAVGRMLNLANQKRKISWLVLQPEQFRPDERPSDQEIKAYYRGHKAAFTTPTTLALHYIQLSPEALKAEIEPDKAALLAWYHSHLSNFGLPPARKAAEILVSPQGSSKQAWTEAKERASQLLEKIHAAENPQKKFAQLAGKYSDAPISGRNRGSIGYVGRGQMPVPFDTALFGLTSIGDIAGPVRTDNGWVLIQLLDKRAGKVKPYAKVKEEVKNEYVAAKVSELYNNLGNKLVNLAFENPNSLQKVARKLDLEIHTVKGVTRKQGPGIAGNQAIRKAAFSDTVLKQHMNSKAVKLGPHNAVVLRVANVEPSNLKSLSRVRGRIVDALMRMQAERAARKASVEAIAALRSGTKALADVARSFGIPLQGPAPIERAPGASSVPAAVATAVFDEPIPAHGEAIYGHVSLNDGSSALYAFKGVVASGEAKQTAKERRAFLAQLYRLHARQEMRAYKSFLRAQADIEINEQNIP